MNEKPFKSDIVCFKEIPQTSQVSQKSEVKKIKCFRRPKLYGNAFERKVAKDFSIWMFDDPDVLKREPTSGASKKVYIGDIYPMKQINWNSFPFNIETKYGYTDRMPTLINYKIIEQWFLKCLDDCRINHQQKIILIVSNFKQRKGIQVVTNQILDDIHWKSAIYFKRNGDYIYGYVYDYDELLTCNFYDVFRKQKSFF